MSDLINCLRTPMKGVTVQQCFKERSEAANALSALQEQNKALREHLKAALATIEDYAAYEHDGDPWSEDSRAMGEMDINEYMTDGRHASARAALEANKQEGGE